jgi:hypothetical protein
MFMLIQFCLGLHGGAWRCMELHGGCMAACTSCLCSFSVAWQCMAFFQTISGHAPPAEGLSHYLCLSPSTLIRIKRGCAINPPPCRIEDP